MALPVLVPIAEQTKPAEVERQLLTEIAQEANAQSIGWHEVLDWQDLRWFVVGKVPRSIVIVKRGSKPVQTVCTISKSKPEAWASWQPVLTEWLAERERTNGKRVNHEKMPVGNL